MLPATKSHRFSLADVLPSCLSAVSADANPLDLSPVVKAVVLVVDGLGAAVLRARAGHARTLSSLLGPRSMASAGFPTTTAASLATITTGQHPGIHGLVGYTALDAANERVVNQLSGWDDRLDPASWQRARTVFERAADGGVQSFVIAAEKYRHSGFTAAVLRGAEFHGASSLAARLETARRILDGGQRSLVYVYTPELDKIAHSHGWQSPKWTEELEALDAAVGAFARELRHDEGLLVTADHGVLDVPESAHVLFDTDPGLIDGIRFVAGEPRCLQLHFQPDASAAHRAEVLERWRASESARAWVVDRGEAIASGWFGPTVDREVVPRIGELIIAARKRVAYYDSRVKTHTGRTMIGQHGSWSQDETEVPLVRLGAWAG